MDIGGYFGDVDILLLFQILLEFAKEYEWLFFNSMSFNFPVGRIIGEMTVFLIKKIQLILLIRNSEICFVVNINVEGRERFD